MAHHGCRPDAADQKLHFSADLKLTFFCLCVCVCFSGETTGSLFFFFKFNTAKSH